MELSAPGEPLNAMCDGFADSKTKVYVIRNGHFTQNYRWCSHWTEEQIRAAEKREFAKWK